MAVLTSTVHEIEQRALNNTVLKHVKELNNFDVYGLTEIFNQFLQYVTNQDTNFTDILVKDDNKVTVLDGRDNVVMGMVAGTPLALSDVFVTDYGLVVVIGYTFKQDEDMPNRDTTFDGNYVDWDNPRYYSIF